MTGQRKSQEKEKQLESEVQARKEQPHGQRRKNATPEKRPIREPIVLAAKAARAGEG